MSYSSAGAQLPPSWNRPYGPPQRHLPPPAPPPSSALGVISLIAGIVAFFFGWVPFVGLFLGLTGLLLSLIAISRPVLRGLAITGIVLSTIALLTSLVTTGFFVLALASDGSDSTTTAGTASYSPEDFVEVDERTLAGIAKEPDAHVGETLIVYGYVTQFDANTGPCEMRLSISAQKQSSWLEYEHNSLAVSGDGSSKCPELSDVIEDDQVKLSVLVRGGKTYSSLGGGTRVPHLEVIDADVID